MRKRKYVSLNEMRERVGRLIYGDDWIGGLTDEDYGLLREHFIPRNIERTDGSIIRLVHVEKCSTQLASKLDMVRGRQERMGAQYVTVDSWIHDHGLPVDPRRLVDRKEFNALIRAEARKAKPASIKTKPRGPEPKIKPRLMAAMKDDISQGRLSQDELDNMPDKELQARYQAKRERVRAARQAVLAELKNN